MKQVTLEEKLMAQVKNINAIVNSENPADVKVAMLEMQKEYLNAYLDELIQSIARKTK
jgi:hypothetical protein